MINTIKAHTLVVKCLLYMRDEKTLLSGSNDMKIKSWNLITLECVKVFSGHDSGVNALLYVGLKDIFISGGWDR